MAVSGGLLSSICLVVCLLQWLVMFSLFVVGGFFTNSGTFHLKGLVCALDVCNSGSTKYCIIRIHSIPLHKAISGELGGCLVYWDICVAMESCTVYEECCCKPSEVQLHGVSEMSLVCDVLLEALIV